LGDAGLSRSEFEYAIPLADARLLLATIEKHIVKTRYKIPHHGKTWDVDVFHGAHEGLIIAEIELSVEDEKFDIPDWVSKEVTGESSYYNANLV
jgi:adenylate cyclase